MSPPPPPLCSPPAPVLPALCLERGGAGTPGPVGTPRLPGDPRDEGSGVGWGRLLSRGGFLVGVVHPGWVVHSPLPGVGCFPSGCSGRGLCIRREGGAQGRGPDHLDTHFQHPWGCRAASPSRTARCGWRRSSSAAAARPPARCRGCGVPPSSPWCSASPKHPGTPRCRCSGGSAPHLGSAGCQLRHPALCPHLPQNPHQLWGGAGGGGGLTVVGCSL